MKQPEDNSLSPTSEEQSYNPVFFKRLASVENEHFWFRTRNEVIRSLVSQIVESFPRGYRVLEIGCGTGNVLRVLGKACQQGKVIGSDLFLGGLRFAKERVSSPLVQADLHALPFESKFYLIGLFDVIEHIPDDEEVLDYLYRMISPAGYLFITVPAHPSLWSYADEGAHHCRRYQQQDLEIKIHSAGFEIEFLTPYMAITFPLMWLVRRLSGLIHGNKSMSVEQATRLTLAEFKVTPVINPILTWLLRYESWFLARRRKLPFGTSLLVLARKPVN
jgi:SAM-dependent methyltransferase